MRKPRLRAGTKLKHDRHGGRWMLLGPERALELSETARAIVELCDGLRTEEDIVKILAQRFDAPEAKLADDVARLLTELRARTLVEDVP